MVVISTVRTVRDNCTPILDQAYRVKIPLALVSRSPVALLPATLLQPVLDSTFCILPRGGLLT